MTPFQRVSITKEQQQQQQKHHSHLAEDEDEEEERPRKRLARGEYVLFYALFGSVTPGEDTWIIDNGASNHMIGKKQTLSRLEEKKSPRRYHWEMNINIPSKVLVNQATSLTLGLP